MGKQYNNDTVVNPYEDTLQKYLSYLISGDRQHAVDLILLEKDKGASVKEIYLHIFQPSQYKVGQLWQANKISVAQEHFCTAVTQLIMSQMYPYIFQSEKKGYSLIAACVGGELHEIGIRMVADFFEMDGWDTYYIGANMPADGILKTIKEMHPDILALSVSMTFHINKVIEIIDLIRSSDIGNSVKIMVGGRAFNVSTDLWKKIHADGYGQDAQNAIILAEKLVNDSQ